MIKLLVLENFIDGKFVKGEKHIDSYNPATGKVHALVPESSVEDVDRAVQAAKRAIPIWSALSTKERSDFMLKIADAVERRLDEFARAESKDQGKPVSLAKAVDVPRCVHNFRFFATAILHSVDEASFQSEFSSLNYTIHAPAGVAGLITPWNLPLYLLSFKLAPAIAAGTCVVCKPSEMTSVTAFMLCQIFQEVGLPPGVVNMVFGTGPVTGSAIIAHKDIKLISFTGSTRIGQYIQEKSAPFVRKLSLELGGKNAGIIFADADMDKCVTTSLRSAFSNQGEICLCTSRLFVERKAFDEFCRRFVQEVRKLKIGPPEESSTNIGALISKEHLEKVKSYVRLALEEGGTILCGEGVDGPLDLPSENREGYFMRPTVVAGLHNKTRCMQEEIFGPVVCIWPFDREEEVIELANDVPYGLAATLWSSNVSTVHRVASKLQAGTVWCNCWAVRDLRLPFGGMKMSGVGREDQRESLEFFTEKKTICVQY